MSQKPSISQAFETIALATESALIDNPLISWGEVPIKINFMSGNLLEVSNRLTEMTNSADPLISNGKYPMVALLKDIKESLTIGLNGFQSSFNARLLIVTLSNPTDRHDTRRDKNFIPILEPIMEEMLRQISKSKAFGMPNFNSMKVKATNCYFYGTNLNNKNQFNDYVDAIDVESISLTLKNIC